jgi:hypothetical protein
MASIIAFSSWGNRGMHDVALLTRYAVSCGLVAGE